MATNPYGDPDDNGTDEILAAMAETALAPHTSEIGPRGMQCYGIPGKKCARCGAPARRSVYHLERQERTLLCGVCRP